MGEAPPPVTRAELLGGLAGRRASLVLYAVESRTAQLALEARHAMAPAVCEDLAVQQQRAFLSALATGRRLDVAPRIQDLERYAPQWADLVPQDATTRAELALRLGEKYRFRARDVPRLRAALGLDEPAVRRAFEERHRRSLDSLLDGAPSHRERWQWLRARITTRLEDLPPFWSAFSLTLTQTVGAGILALPIALAGVGPLPGLALVTALGLVNVLTAVAVAESFARTGTVRWGGAYFGRVVTQHLGRAAGVVLSLTLAALSLVALLAYYVGLSSTIGIATGTPAALWAASLFAATLAFVWRGRLDATVMSALIVGGVNILVIVILSVLTLGHFDAANFTFVDMPFVGGRPFDPAILGLVFGVVLISFFGHTAVANGARVILRRDESGRSLVRGTAAAMFTAIALYGAWGLAVGSAVNPARLAAESGTALAPLAEVIGPAVLVVGGVFVVLAMGMAAVHFSMGIHFQTVELLGARGRVARFGGLVPLVGVFVAVEWLLLTGRESFTGALGLVGTLTATLLAGVFPVLLLAAARRRGDYVPADAARWIGHLVVLAMVYALFLGAVVAHGAVIWQTAPERAAAFVTAVVVVAVTLWAARSGAFVPLATVEVRRDRELGRHRLRVTVNGRRAQVMARLRQADGWTAVAVDGAVDLPERTRAIAIDLGSVDARQLRVWAHEVDPSAATTPLPARVSVRNEERTTALELVNGQVTVSIGTPPAVLEVQLTPDGGRGIPPAGDRS